MTECVAAYLAIGCAIWFLLEARFEGAPRAIEGATPRYAAAWIATAVVLVVAACPLFYGVPLAAGFWRGMTRSQR